MTTELKSSGLTLHRHEVHAILDGTLKQIRRPINVPTSHRNKPLREVVPTLLPGHPDVWDCQYYEDTPIAISCPLGRVGQTLWGKEAWAHREDTEPGSSKALHYLVYRADRDRRDRLYDDWHSYGQGWRSEDSMPEWASRIRLRIESIVPQNALDISEQDAKDEGFHTWTKDGHLWKWGLARRHSSGEFDATLPWKDMKHSHLDAMDQVWSKLLKPSIFGTQSWFWLIRVEVVKILTVEDRRGGDEE